MTLNGAVPSLGEPNGGAIQLSWAVIAPTYNHAASLLGVLEELDLCGLVTIVVNDGATDHTAAVLDRWINEPSKSARRVLTHTTNLGKAQALRTGFTEAARAGFTHAATIDSDGQHEVADLVRLVRASALSPGALLVGARTTAGSGAPIASRLGRSISNAMVWLESGVRVTDSQSGLRVYPLAHLSVLDSAAPRYGFETEVLVRAGWHGVTVIEQPIRCIYRLPGGRTTHFRLFADTARAVAMHARLLWCAHLAQPVMAQPDRGSGSGTIFRRLASWFSPRRLFRMARGSAVSKERLAASVGVGLLIATLPIYGIKTVTCLWIAARFRLHPLAVVGVSSLSSPPVGLVFVAMSVAVGGLLLNGQWPSLTMSELRDVANWSGLSRFLVDWLVGSVVVGTSLGILGFVLTRAVLARSPNRPREVTPQPADLAIVKSHPQMPESSSSR